MIFCISTDEETDVQSSPRVTVSNQQKESQPVHTPSILSCLLLVPLTTKQRANKGCGQAFYLLGPVAQGIPQWPFGGILHSIHTRTTKTSGLGSSEMLK